MNILFRCDGSHEIGLGHVVRCMALADELSDVHGCHVMFAMRKSDLGAKIVSGKYAVIHSDRETDSFNYRQWLKQALKHNAADVLILDVRDGLNRKDLDKCKAENLLIVDIDDPEEKRLSADLAFYPPVPRAKALNWAGFKGDVCIGWEWIILRSMFVRPVFCPAVEKAHIFKILVAMGGTDPMGMTVIALKALERISQAIEITLVLGKGFAHLKEVEKVLPGISHGVDIKKDVQNMALIMGKMDLALISFGMTAYELAAMGVPAVYLCLSRDHLENARLFIKSKLAYDAWLYNEIEIDCLSKAMTTFIGNNYLKKQMGKQTSGIVDGHGARRIAKRIMMQKQTF